MLILIIIILIIISSITLSVIKLVNNNGPSPGPSPGPGPGPSPGPSSDWVNRSPDKQSDGVTHYWDCCKESCSWFNNAPDYGTNQCDKFGLNPADPDTSSKFPKNVCDDPDGNATCQNRYPEIIVNSDGSKTLMGFVAIGKELFPDFAPDKNNNYCGQCYEIEFSNTNPNTNIKNSIVQVTNTGDANGIFDFEVPGGGFGAHNGCLNYNNNNNAGWKVYKTQGGPCDTTTSTCTGNTPNIEGCAIYGGFQTQKYCDTSFGSDTKAQKACNDILWGVFPSQGNNHCPGFPNNLKISRYRSIKCPKWHTEKTGKNASKAPVALKAKKINEKCSGDFECSTRNCYQNSCQEGNIPDGKPCSYNKQCLNNYCDNNNQCNKRTPEDACWYNDSCFVNGSLTCDKTTDYCKSCPSSQKGQSSDNLPDFTTDTQIKNVTNWGDINTYNNWLNGKKAKSVYCKF